MGVKRSLYRKLVLYFIGVLFVTMAILGIVQTNQMRDYLVREREQVLIRSQLQLAGRLAQFERGLIPFHEFTLNVAKFESSNHVRVTLVDGLGTIVYKGVDINSAVDNAIRQALTSFQPSTAETTFNQVTFASPLIFQNQLQGIVVFSVPVSGQDLYLEAIRSIFYSGAIAIAIAVVITYFISRHLTRPLNDLRKAAVRISRGDFQQRVAVKTSDEIGHLAETFNQMMVRLEELEGIRREFIASVSHELRSPLTSIRGFVQGMVDHVIPEEEKDHYLQLTLKETQRLNRLIDQLLDAARIESGQFTLEKENVDLVELVRHAVTTMEPAIREKRQKLRVQLPDTKVQCQVDPDRVEQIIINLVSNAWQYTPEEGEISVSLEPLGDKVKITVSDTGEGILESDLPHIWDRFFKADRSRTSKKVGTGLGLSIVKSLVEAHEGKITVKSRMGAGTTFTVLLPLA